MASFVQMIAGSAVGCAAPRMTTEAQRATTASLEDAKEASRAPRSSGSHSGSQDGGVLCAHGLLGGP